MQETSELCMLWMDFPVGGQWWPAWRMAVFIHQQQIATRGPAWDNREGDVPSSSVSFSQFGVFWVRNFPFVSTRLTWMFDLLHTIWGPRRKHWGDFLSWHDYIQTTKLNWKCNVKAKYVMMDVSPCEVMRGYSAIPPPSQWNGVCLASSQKGRKRGREIGSKGREGREMTHYAQSLAQCLQAFL